jgi:hypothetical protein
MQGKVLLIDGITLLRPRIGHSTAKHETDGVSATAGFALLKAVLSTSRGSFPKRVEAMELQLNYV